MKYLNPSFTMDQCKPNPDYCCEACVFGKGEHSEWCEKRAACPECGGNCAPECGMHPLGCVFGGSFFGAFSDGYWLIVEGCTLSH